MRIRVRRGPLLGLCVAVGAMTAAQPTYRAVYYPPHQMAQPSGITEGSPGLFYIQADVLFILSVTTKGVATTLATFQDPAYGITSAPVSAANHLVYSSVADNSSSSGNIFSAGPTAGSQRTYGAEGFDSILAQNLPEGKLLAIAGAYSNRLWNLATVDLNCNLTTFYQFPSGDLPNTALYGSDGNYYGTANTHDAAGYVYKLTPSGSFTKLATVPFPGVGLVIQASDGNFYGTTPVITGAYAGSVFKLTPGGRYTVLHTFGDHQAGVIDTLLEGSDGNIYGVTEGQTFFSLTPSGQYKVAYQELNGYQGVCPCSMIQASDGIIYGTAMGGGQTGSGEVFALDLGLPKPAPRAQHFHPQSGGVGALVRIWGYNLLRATVQFNGVAATTISNSGPNYVWATVPAGATSGPITITTPGGTITTTANFTVR